jgi:hypothetical protein
MSARIGNPFRFKQYISSIRTVVAPLWVAAVFSFKEEIMEWIFIDPSKANPESFDLAKIFACKVKEFSGQENLMSIRTSGWKLFADLRERCPVSGHQLQESTWYLYAAHGRS